MIDLTNIEPAEGQKYPASEDCAFGEPEFMHRHHDGCPACLPYQIDGIYKNCEWVRGVTQKAYTQSQM